MEANRLARFGRVEFEVAARRIGIQVDRMKTLPSTYSISEGNQLGLTFRVCNEARKNRRSIIQ
jgi:hypothetical protein